MTTEGDASWSFQISLRLIVVFQIWESIECWPFVKNNMMKFEKQRIGQSHSSKLEISNPDYLTFRNNPCENTGRTVYSQQFDCRSLEKYPPDEEMSPLPKYNFKKNNLRNVRSQEKFRQIHEELIFERSNDENG